MCGPRTAIISGSPTHHANYWIFTGFRVTNLGYAGWFFRGAAFNLVDGIEIDHSQQELLVLADASHDNIVRNSSFHDSGLGAPRYGEGIYIGNGSTDSDPADNNQVIGNWFGPNIRAEHVDVKRGTSGNVVEGNMSDATGHQYLEAMTTALYITGGTNTKFLDNVITNLHSPKTAAFQNWQGSETQWHGNRVSGTFEWGFNTVGGGGNVVGCDNTVRTPSIGFATVTCR